MKNQSITINTDQISIYRGRSLGRVFYNAYMNFVKEPENEKIIKQRAKEIREKERSEQASNENT